MDVSVCLCKSVTITVPPVLLFPCSLGGLVLQGMHASITEAAEAACNTVRAVNPGMDMSAFWARASTANPPAAAYAHVPEPMPFKMLPTPSHRAQSGASAASSATSKGDDIKGVAQFSMEKFVDAVDLPPAPPVVLVPVMLQDPPGAELDASPASVTGDKAPVLIEGVVPATAGTEVGAVSTSGPPSIAGDAAGSSVASVHEEPESPLVLSVPSYVQTSALQYLPEFNSDHELQWNAETVMDSITMGTLHSIVGELARSDVGVDARAKLLTEACTALCCDDTIALLSAQLLFALAGQPAPVEEQHPLQGRCVVFLPVLVVVLRLSRMLLMSAVIW